MMIQQPVRRVRAGVQHRTAPSVPLWGAVFWPSCCSAVCASIGLPFARGGTGDDGQHDDARDAACRCWLLAWRCLRVGQKRGGFCPSRSIEKPPKQATVTTLRHFDDGNG